MRPFRLASFAAILALAINAVAQAQDLPEGQGKALVQSACSQCHSLDVIIGHPRSRADWTDVVSQMVGNGAELSDADYNQVVDYLATHVGTTGQSAPANKP